MDKTVLISLPVEELQSIITDCVTSCLRYNQSNGTNHLQQPLTIKEASGYAHCASSTIRKSVRHGKLKYFRQSGRLFFYKEDLDTWIRKGGE